MLIVLLLAAVVLPDVLRKKDGPEVTAVLSAQSLDQFEPLLVSIVISNPGVLPIEGFMFLHVTFERQEGSTWERCTPWPMPNRTWGDPMYCDRFRVTDPIRISIAPGSSFAWESWAVCSPVTHVRGNYRLRPVSLHGNAPNGPILASQPVPFVVRPNARNAEAFADREQYYDMLERQADLAYLLRTKDRSTLSRSIRDYASACLAERALRNRDWSSALEQATFSERSSCSLTTGGVRGWARYMGIVARWHMAGTQAEFDRITVAFDQLLAQHPDFRAAWDPDTYPHLRGLLPP